jgi:ribosomal protein S10
MKSPIDKTKKLYIISVHADRMGQSDNFEFVTHERLIGLSETPFITVYEARKLTEKERKELARLK